MLILYGIVKNPLMWYCSDNGRLYAAAWDGQKFSAREDELWKQGQMRFGKDNGMIMGDFFVIYPKYSNIKTCACLGEMHPLFCTWILASRFCEVSLQCLGKTLFVWEHYSDYSASHCTWTHESVSMLMALWQILESPQTKSKLKLRLLGNKARDQTSQCTGAVRQTGRGNGCDEVFSLWCHLKVCVCIKPGRHHVSKHIPWFVCQLWWWLTWKQPDWNNVSVKGCAT